MNHVEFGTIECIRELMNNSVENERDRVECDVQYENADLLKIDGYTARAGRKSIEKNII